MTARRIALGELRPSQLLHTYGVGAVIDLPFLSVMVMGLDDWEEFWKSSKPITEDRLLAQVRKQLGPQVESLCSPPKRLEASLGFRGGMYEQDIVGVPVAPFPLWMRCPACNSLAPISSGLFELKPIPGRPDLAKYVHHVCHSKTRRAALPARFLMACEAGHLDDFPWTWFVHKGSTSCNGNLILQELGASGEAVDVLVKCLSCGADRRMADAFGKEAAKNLRCAGVEGRSYAISRWNPAESSARRSCWVHPTAGSR